MASLWLALMRRKLKAGFSAKTLNVMEDATPLMERVLGASEQTNLNLLREHLAECGLHAISEKYAADTVRDVLRANINSTRHLMSQLGWTASKVKWDGCDFAWSVWTEKGFSVGRGRVTGPNGYDEALSQHFDRVPEVQHLK